jgi:hypothetical protein
LPALALALALVLVLLLLLHDRATIHSSVCT